VAHGQGRVVVPEGDLRGVLPRAPMRYVDNPNGSVCDIAGVCNASGTVLGLMPHPERAVEVWQYPRRSAGPIPAGLRIFSNAIAYVRSL
jgi:phosphoribosylformylglycinamidine (FGAM) synthase-like amidotransferase family enzyme